jgi:hypothetical protein
MEQEQLVEAFSLSDTEEVSGERIRLRGKIGVSVILMLCERNASFNPVVNLGPLSRGTNRVPLTGESGRLNPEWTTPSVGLKADPSHDRGRPKSLGCGFLSFSATLRGVENGARVI